MKSVSEIRTETGLPLPNPVTRALLRMLAFAVAPLLAPGARCAAVVGTRSHVAVWDRSIDI